MQKDMKMDEMFVELRKEIVMLADSWSVKLLALPVEVISDRRNSQNRTIRQILGHLVDSAVNNHHRIVRLQYVNALEFPDYRQDNDRWIAIQNYQEEDWTQLVSFWKLYNLHMVHIIKYVDKDCLDHTWHDFEGTRETLTTIIEGYLWHLNLHLKEITELINE
jgi:hypothetical protein